MTGIHRKPTVSALTSRRRVSWRYPGDPSALCAAWRAETAVTWSRPRDWWVAEVDALVEALASAGTSVAVLPACARLGQARADAGVGLTEALDDLCALYRVLPVGSPPLPVLRAFVESWADEWLAALTDPGCVDPLTELTSRAYLRTRLAELYRALGDQVPERHALLVLALQPGEGPTGAQPADGPAGPSAGGAGGWRMLIRRLAVAEALRSVFVGGETLTALTAHRSVALVERTQPTLAAVATLRDQLARRRGVGRVRLWLTRLPDRPADVGDLLTRLSET